MAHNTDKLKLYVYDTKTDGSMLFSITESMTNNFVKIDNYAKSTDETLEDLVDKEYYASEDRAGLVKIGKNLSISIDGTLSATATGDVDPEDLKDLIEEYLGSINGKKPGEIIVSLDPIDNNPSIRLLDGSILQFDSMYKNFIEGYILPLKDVNPDRFITEAKYQEYLNKYGKCGYYVCDEENKYLRLPTLTGILQGTNVANTSGAITEAGMPNISMTESANHDHNYNQTNISSSHESVLDSVTVSAKLTGIPEIAEELLEGVQIELTTDTTYHEVLTDVSVTSAKEISSLSGAHSHSLEGELLGKSQTIQPETTNVYYYMVVADKVSFTSSALTLEAALSTINSLSESVSSMITISEDSGGNTDPETGELIDMEDGFFRISSGICVQWGILRGAQDTITFQVPFVGNKYSFFINPINATYSYKELDKQGSYIKINRGSGSPDCYWMAMGLAADYNFDEPEIPEEGELELE